MSFDMEPNRDPHGECALEIRSLTAERDALKVENEKWKDECFNLCKFTNNYVNRHDALKAENAKLAACLTEKDNLLKRLEEIYGGVFGASSLNEKDDPVWQAMKIISTALGVTPVSIRHNVEAREKVIEAAKQWKIANPLLSRVDTVKALDAAIDDLERIEGGK